MGGWEWGWRDVQLVPMPRRCQNVMSPRSETCARGGRARCVPCAEQSRVAAARMVNDVRMLMVLWWWLGCLVMKNDHHRHLVHWASWPVAQSFIARGGHGGGHRGGKEGAEGAGREGREGREEAAPAGPTTPSAPRAAAPHAAAAAMEAATACPVFESLGAAGFGNRFPDKRARKRARSLSGTV